MDTSLPGLIENMQELIPLNVIRTETALSRFPVHRISKKGSVRIELKNHEAALLWKVSYNTEYGQPGPLAYKLDTLIVNRRIEAVGRPVPKLIRLGSLRDIADELGAGEKNTGIVKNALLQNASAFINAKLSYRAIDKTIRWVEIADTRYGVVFTGEKLPNGEDADAVYLVLHDNYRAILDAAVTRPLDYDYMRALPPAAQRFYEIVSYQIFGALLHANERAKLRYSEYCLLSTATRYMDFDHVKKQMYKIHRPHIDSGYIVKVSYEITSDADGQPDWWMYYTPGPNASREYSQFTGRGANNRRTRRLQEGKKEDAYSTPCLPFAEISQELENASQGYVNQRSAVPEQTELTALIESLTVAGLNRADAERLAKEQTEECKKQLTYLPFIEEFRSSPGAYLRSAIEQGFAPPVAYTKQRQAEEARKRAEDEALRKKVAQKALLARRAEETAKTDEEMLRLEKEAPEAFSGFIGYIAEQKRTVQEKNIRMPESILNRLLQTFETPEKRRELFHQWRQLPEFQQNAPYLFATIDKPEDPEQILAVVATSFSKSKSE